MFVLLLFALLVAAAVHVARAGDRSVGRAGEIFLLWLLVGYCGFATLLVAVATLLAPAHVADVLGYAPGGPLQEFLGVAFLGMSLVSILALRWRGTYLIGPAVLWAVFFAGATAVHLRSPGSLGALSHADVVHVLASHALVAVLLVAALLASGLPRRR